MSNTIYATFANPEDAERAAGALLDHGVRPEDLSVVRRHHDGFTPMTEPTASASNVPLDTDVVAVGTKPLTPPPVEGSVYGAIPDSADSTVRTPVTAEVYDTEDDVEETAKHGITTTTAADASAGAVKGGLVGAGIGAIAAIAALIVPGVGLVMGAGALAAALGGIAATAGAGAAAGAIVGYLKDMGVDEQVATTYSEAVEGGGAILAVTVPSGNVDEAEATAVLNKYAATNVNRYASRGYVA
ncbi:hypothetical protein EON82_18515 [bacterium]|nr:MAG: hypothetical protein EON82_18515 [bacterium]